MRSRLGCFACLAVLAWASTAQAQIDVPPMDMAGAMFNGQATRGILESHLGLDRGDRPSERPDLRPSSPRQLPAAATRYRRDPAITRKVVNDYLAFVARTDPHELAAVRDQLDRNDVEAAWSRQTASDGFRSGDAVDALAAYWLLNWIISNGRDNTSAQAAGVRAQVRSVLADTPQFIAMPEAQRQEFSENLMVNFLFQQNSYLAFNKKGDQAKLKAAAQAATVRFRDQLGIDPQNLALTAAGFARRD